MWYFKIPLCRILAEKSKTNQGQTAYERGVLGQKLGYDKVIYKINVKKDIQCSLNTMNIEVLRIFQGEYHPRCFNHSSSLLCHY